jgi:hypothetical protein
MNAHGCNQDFDHVGRLLKWHFTLLLMMSGLGITQLVYVLTLPEVSPMAADQFSHQRISLVTGGYCTLIVLLSLTSAWLYGRCQIQLGMAYRVLDKLGRLANFQQTKRDEALEQYAQLVGALSDVSARMEIIVREVDPHVDGVASERGDNCVDELRAACAASPGMDHLKTTSATAHLLKASS